MGKDPRRLRIRKGMLYTFFTYIYAHSTPHHQVFADATLVFPLLVAATFARDIHPP